MEAFRKILIAILIAAMLLLIGSQIIMAQKTIHRSDDQIARVDEWIRYYDMKYGRK